MRIFFSLLVLINVGFWMWSTWFYEPDGYDPPQPSPPVAEEKMRLLSDASVRRVARQTRLPVCYRVGPLIDAGQISQAERKLKSAGVSFERVEEPMTATTYRVVLPPSNSKEVAEQQRKNLTKLGITDHMLLNEEGMKNAVAVGLFKEEANATARVKQLGAKGIQATVQPLVFARLVSWLALRAGAGDEPLAETAVAKLKAESWGAGVGLEKKGCGLPPVPVPP